MEAEPGVIHHLSLFEEASSRVPSRVRAQRNTVKLITFGSFEPGITQQYQADGFISLLIGYDNHGNRWSCSFVHMPRIKRFNVICSPRPSVTQMCVHQALGQSVIHSVSEPLLNRAIAQLF